MIKFDFKKNADGMFKKSKMLYVISNDFNKRMRYALEKVKLNQFKKILIVTEKSRLKETVSLIYKLKLSEQIIVVNYASLKKVIDIKLSAFYISKTYNDLKHYATELNDSQIKPVIFKGNFKKPDIIVIDSAYKLGAYPKPNKAAQELRKLSQGIPIIATGFTITPNGKLPKLFHQLYALNRTKISNFYLFAKKFVNVKDINSRYSIINSYDELNVKGKKWYDSIVNDIVIDIDGDNKYKNNDTIHTLALPEKILSMVKNIYNNNTFSYNGEQCRALEPEIKHKYIHQLLSGTVKIGKKYFIIDDFKAKFINKYYSKYKILIIYRYISEKVILEKEFQHMKNVTIIGYVNNLPKEKYDYIIFYNLSFIVTKYQNIVSTYNNIKKVYVFSRNGLESDIYNKLKMQLSSI